MRDIATLNRDCTSTTEIGYAKINLALDVTGRLDNGYHLVKMIMESISLSDTLTYTCSSESGIRLTCDLSGISTGTEVLELSSGEDNLIVRAARALLNAAGVDESQIGLDIALVKNIPMAAGMAGGSADAAATLRAINRLYDCGMSIDELCAIGVKLGADIPYCIRGGSYLSEGIGEVLTAIAMPPKAHILVIKPNIDVSTKYVYEHLDTEGVETHPDVDGMVEALAKGDLIGITDRLGNVLRDVTVGKYPIVLELEEFMKEHGAMNALMSGSGPTVFGIYDDELRCRQAMELAQKQYADMYIATAEFVN